MRRHLLLSLVFLCCITVSCTAPKADTNTAPAADSTPGPKIVATIKDIMDTMVDPSADYIWESIGTEVSAAGIKEKYPRNPEEWKEERRHAMALVEAANLLVMPGRRVAQPGEKSENPGIELGPDEIQALIDKNRPTFIRLAKEFQDTAIEQLKAVDDKDLQALLKTGGDIDTRCENCHKTYWYPNDPAFANQPKETDKENAQQKK
jgi:hypothetical protein